MEEREYKDVKSIAASEYLDQYRTDPYFRTCVEAFASAEDEDKIRVALDAMSQLCNILSDLYKKLEKQILQSGPSEMITLHLLKDRIGVNAGQFVMPSLFGICAAKSEPEKSEYNVDDYNEYHYRNCSDSSVTVFICKKCKNKVSKDGSYSDQGKNLYCDHCVKEAARKCHISVSEWCSTHIWCNGELSEYSEPDEVDMTEILLIYKHICDASQCCDKCRFGKYSNECRTCFPNMYIGHINELIDECIDWKLKNFEEFKKLMKSNTESK